MPRGKSPEQKAAARAYLREYRKRMTDAQKALEKSGARARYQRLRSNKSSWALDLAKRRERKRVVHGRVGAGLSHDQRRLSLWCPPTRSMRYAAALLELGWAHYVEWEEALDAAED